MRRRFAEKWRVLAWRRNGEQVAVQDDGAFDELVFENVLHIEQMDNRRWWMRLGDAAFYIHIPTKGPMQIIIGFGDQHHEGYNDTEWEIRGTPERLIKARRESMNEGIA